MKIGSAKPLFSFVCYVLVTMFLPATKAPAQSTNCALLMNCPSNIVVTSCFNVQEFYTPTASNICCGVNSTVTCSPPSGSIFAVGTTTTVNCTATDCAQNTNFCSFTVTVVPGNCATNYLQVQCPSNIVVSSCTNISVSYAPTVTDSACSNWTVTLSPPSGSSFAPGTTNLVDCFVSDYCGLTNDCSFTVTVLPGSNCPTNFCLTNLGPRTISWLQLPTNTTHLLPNPLGGNTSLTWIITNLPGYGNVLVTQDAPTNVIVLCTNSDFGRVHAGSSFDNVPQSSGFFYYTEATYGPYSWGVLPGSVELAYAHTNIQGPFPSYQVTFWFLDGQPNYGQLVLSTIGMAQFTTNTLSQPLTFRTEYDLLGNLYNYPQGPSAPTTLDGYYGLSVSGRSGTVVGSANSSVPNTDDYNTGYAIFQPTNDLNTALLPPGTGMDVNGNNYPPYGSSAPPYPYLTVKVDNQQHGDIFSLTVGYVCCGNCPTNCLQVQGTTNKTVECGSTWTFDTPSATSCCTNEIGGPAGGTNVLITPISVVTNGSCPGALAITTTWAIVDGCGDSNSWSQTVFVVGCCSNCLQVTCPADKTVQCGETNWSFDLPTATTCCTNLIDGDGSGPTTVVVRPIGITTNGVCPQYVTETWLIFDGCGNTTNCSQTVTVECCATNCITLVCPSNIIVTTCSNCATAFYAATASNTCCFSNVVVQYSLPSGTCFPIGTTTVDVTAYDPDCASTPPTSCSFTVTVVQGTNCCASQCCGPNLGAQTINWLQLPTNGPTLVPNPSGANGSGTWIITNLPCYGNVLITQDPVTNVAAFFAKNADFDNVPNNFGEFEFTDGGYGPYLWGTTPGWLDLYYNQVGPVPNYQVSFYFLDGPPNPCNLVLAVIGIAEYTTNVVSQPVTFRSEYDITNSFGQLVSSYTALSGTYGSPLITGVSGNVVSSPYSVDGNIGNDFNTGFALFQPDAALLMTNLPSGSGVDINGNPYPTPGTNLPYVTFTVTHQAGDSFGLTVGYICCQPCSTNCLQVICPANKTIPCGETNWSFDTPIATSCCTNNYDGTPTSPPTNVLVLPIRTETNGGCPQALYITQTWQISDPCGDITNCSQTVTVECCGTNANCLVVVCPTNKTVPCGTNWSFDAPIATSCCTNTVDGTGGSGGVLVIPTDLTSNGVCPQVAFTQNWLITDGCGNSTNCSQIVIVLGCCTNCLQVQAPPPNKTVPCGTNWDFDEPTATSCCTNLIDSTTGVATNVLITSLGIVSNSTCPLMFSQSWLITDACGDSNVVTQTVTVFGCCTNCCGPNAGPETIHWLELPSTNATALQGDPTGSNGPGTWIVTNLPCYGRVLVTQTFPDAPNLTYWFLNPNFLNVPYAPDGQFNDVEGGYGPYSWGTFDSILDFYNASGSTSITYTVNFYFLDGAPNPCLLVLGVVGLAEFTTATVSQPVTFRGEYDLYATDVPGNHRASAYTTLDGNYPAAGLSGTTVGSAYAVSGPGYLVGDWQNTGWSLLQPNNPLATGPLPSGSGAGWPGPMSGVPYMSLVVTQQFYDGIGFTVGYICGCCSNCAMSCLQVTCPTNKTIPCGETNWSFDMPIATSCCTNNYDGTPTQPPTNVLILPIGTVTNGGCPKALYITQTWQISDPCGNITNCSQTVTVECCETNTNCLQVICPTNMTVPCGSTWTFGEPIAHTCCASNIPGTKTNLMIVPTGLTTNGLCPQVISQGWLITDGCGSSETCTQTVTVVDTNAPFIQCQTNVYVVSLNSNCDLVIPLITATASDPCTPYCDLKFSQSPTNGTIIHGTTATVTITVMDMCSNSASCQVKVVGVPKTGLVVDWPTNVVSTNCLVPCVTVTAVDCACPLQIPLVTQVPPCGQPIGPGVSAILVTVTDCNNTRQSKWIPLVVAGEESFLGALTNTGVGLNGHLLPASAVDPHYTLDLAPLTPPPGYTAPNAVVVTNLWLPLEIIRVSQWIAPTTYLPPGYDLASCVTGDYIYTNHFTLPAGSVPATATISGRWAADNGAVQMKLNNTVTGNVIPGLNGFSGWSYFTINSGFVSGLNTITFVVTNQGPSPTGLRVEYLSANVCSTCAPPVIVSTSGSGTLQVGSTATLGVKAVGVPPLTYQWQFNNVDIEGATNATLQIENVAYANAGLYSAAVSNPCGGGGGTGGGGNNNNNASAQMSLQVTPVLPWPNAEWEVADLSNPLGATYGPDLILAGQSETTNYALATGTTEDFGLPNPGGQIVNVVDINPQAGGTILLPPVTASGATADNNFTLIMDIYEPDTSAGSPSTLYESASCCVSNLSSGGQDGLALTLDGSNYVHIVGSAGGVPFDSASAAPLAVDAWNRVVLVSQSPQDGIPGTLSAYINGQIAINPCVCCFLQITNVLFLNWSSNTPSVLSPSTDGVSINAELYASSLQFHAVAMTSAEIAGLGSPDSGPLPVNETLIGASPVLSATWVNGAVNISWPGSPYALQESTDLSGGMWADSQLPFTETLGSTGNLVTTAVVRPATGGPSKFYRLVFRP